MPPPPEGDGPDGSSIRPVSSLLARFENMSKPSIDSPPSIRSTSPAPRLDKPRRSVSPLAVDRSSAPPPPPVKPKPRNSSSFIHSNSSTPALLLPPGAQSSDPSSSPALLSSASTSFPPPGRLGLPPPLSPRPSRLPPSLLVEPPHSPPKGRAGNLAPSGTDHSGFFLNPDSVVKTPLSPSTSPRLPKIPSRPHTPVLDVRRSPHLPPSQPPSPPPPRRSAELRRERDKPKPDKPRPKIPSQQFTTLPSSPYPSALDRRSPFSSPPSSSESLDMDNEQQPPTLPARPRPQSYIHNQSQGHRKDQSENHHNDQPSSRPPLPTRPQSQIHTSQAVQPMQKHIPAPSRPTPRSQPSRSPVALGFTESNGGTPSSNTPGPSTPVSNAPSQNTVRRPRSPSKRVVSNPTASNSHSTVHFPPPPSRTQHGRSMTVDRINGRQITASSLGLSANGFSSASESPSTAAATGGQGFDSAPAAPSATPVSLFPDAKSINRRPPYAKQACPEINTKYDCRQMDVCGQRVVTTGNLTRVWNLLDGELLMSLAHGDNIKATCVAFKPAARVEDEGTRLWIGNTVGELMEADIATQSIVASRAAAHGRNELVKIHRHYDELWTICTGGSLYVWGPSKDNLGLGEGGVPSLSATQHQSFRLPRGHTFSLVAGDELWHAAGRELRIFLPTLDGKAQFQVLLRALVQDGAGEISAGTVLLSDPDKILFGHTDGKVSIYSRADYSCVEVVSLGSYKVNALASVGSYIWAGYNTGRLCVYDTRSTPWTVKKDWVAHENPVIRIVADRSSAYHLDQPAQVVSLGADNIVHVWDGLLQNDWLEEAMQAKDVEYCHFETIRAHVMTWNAGASTPGSLRYAEDDSLFMQNLLKNSGSPDIFVFGFQELVDLEDKTATAKRILKPKKKEGSDQERMSYQYRDWRDFLVRCLDDYMDGELYHLLHTSHMVGLFTCIFVKADLRSRIHNVASMEVKRGMGGLHGNKGAIVIRFLVDDTSLCFVNCHLAAGQSQSASRHNDAAAILDSPGLPIERDANARIDCYTGGGDGTMIVDHELCVLNGDLNYRIDTMSRDAVVGAVKAGNLAKLLDRDQLLVARRRNAGFRLRAFDELPIQFAPTYKYDVGTDNYDSSEKKRSPAWCDRLLFRGGHSGRIRQLDYLRHEVRVSDHRPVTGRFELVVKQVDAKRRAVAWMECQQSLEDYKSSVARDENIYYLTHIIGYDAKTSEKFVRERMKHRSQRTRSQPT